MGKVTAYLSLSLDGFVAGANAGVGNPLGDGGERLHEWVVGLKSWREGHGLEGGVHNGDSDIVEQWQAGSGAYVMGRNMFDEGEGPWGDPPPFGKPVFVVTHRARPTIEKSGGTSYIFVTDGFQAAIARARAAAGDENVVIAGGADVVRQGIKTGLLDELQLHLVPILLGSGVRLFEGLGPEVELRSTRVVSATPNVTHLLFDI
jgi:dihydrofolate reductase